MNSILGVQCHKVNKRFFLLTEKQYVIVLCETSLGCFKMDSKEEDSRFYGSNVLDFRTSEVFTYVLLEVELPGRIYLFKLLLLLMPIEELAVFFIGVACDLFSMLTWHDVLGSRHGMNGSRTFFLFDMS